MKLNLLMLAIIIYCQNALGAEPLGEPDSGQDEAKCQDSNIGVYYVLYGGLRIAAVRRCSEDITVEAVNLLVNTTPIIHGVSAIMDIGFGAVGFVFAIDGRGRHELNLLVSPLAAAMYFTEISGKKSNCASIGSLQVDYRINVPPASFAAGIRFPLLWGINERSRGPYSVYIPLSVYMGIGL